MLRRMSIGTVSVDRSGQRELFFQEEAKTRNFHLVQDAIDNKHGSDTITKAAVMDSVPWKTHFLERS